jgi:5-methylcytosine-specific restriction endonuclease McrA
MSSHMSHADLAILHKTFSENDWIEYAKAERKIRRKRTDWKETVRVIVSQNYRAKRRNLSSRVYTLEWEVVLAKCGYRCVKCGETDWLQMDHIIPLKLGGAHSRFNIQPLCQWCHKARSHDRAMDFRPYTRTRYSVGNLKWT